MSAEISIRKAIPSEVEALADIAFSAWERDLRPFLSGQAANRQFEKRRLSLEVHNQLDRIIVADLAGLAVGWCSRQQNRAYIPYLFVVPDLQNHGIGTLLLRRMESLLELEGAEKVHLNTLADNVRAVSFYQHQGYQILALKQETRNGQDETSIRLEKRLAPYRGTITDTED